MVYLVISLIAFGMLLDTASLVLEFRRWAKGSGPSGIPALGLVLYASACVLLAIFTDVSIARAGIYFALLLVFHLSMQYLIPLTATVVYNLRKGRKPFDLSE